MYNMLALAWIFSPLSSILEVMHLSSAKASSIDSYRISCRRKTAFLGAISLLSGSDPGHNGALHVAHIRTCARWVQHAYIQPHPRLAIFIHSTSFFPISCRHTKWLDQLYSGLMLLDQYAYSQRCLDWCLDPCQQGHHHKRKRSLNHKQHQKHKESTLQ